MSEITNNFTYPVIQLDSKDPDISWQHHLDRGSSGGVDLAYPYGSRVLANADGVITNIQGSGSGGWIAQLKMSDGRYIEYMHLSGFSRSAGASVRIGDEIGRSGASGFGSMTHYGSHLHVHLYIGATRVNLFHYFSETAQPTAKDEFMRNIIMASTGNAYTIGPQYMHHLSDANYVGAAVRAYGPMETYDDTAIHCLTDTLGIPWNVIPTIGPGAGWAYGRGLFSYPW